MSTHTTTRLTGIWINIGRITWGVLALLMTALFLYSLTTLPAITEAARQEAMESGTPLFLALIGIIRRYVVIIFYYAGSGFLFWKRSDDRIVLIASMMLLAVGSFPAATGVLAIATQVMEVPIFWQWLTMCVLIVAIVLALLTVFVYPDGYFFPSWGRWMLIPAVVGGIAYGVMFQVRQSLPVDVITLMMFLLITSIWMQFRRFQQASGTQRQQIKLFMFGVAGFVVFQMVGVIFYVLGDGADFGGDLLTVISEVSFMLAYVSVLMSLSFAVVRHRLWDIDFVINRSLVYGGLTMLLGAAFLVGFFAVQTVVNALLSEPQPTLSAIIGLVLVLTLYQPARNRIRRFIDQRFYGIEIDYNEIARRKPAPAPLSSTDEANMFEIYGELEPIGRGGMGVVYGAVHPSTGEPIAIKLIKEAEHAARDEVIARFNREARTMIGLNHPNIVSLYEVGLMRQMPYITMERIIGQSLSEMLGEREYLPLDEALPILSDIAAGLDYAHERGIIHRDIKPGNVMIDTVSPDRHAVIMDFGIARITAATRLTHSGGVVGTLDYIAPEQIQASERIDHRADIYSFGVLAYQTLTGELPFRNQNMGALLMAHIMQPPPDARQKMPQLPARVALAIMQAMAKEPDSRFDSASAFIGSMIDP